MEQRQCHLGPRRAPVPDPPPQPLHKRLPLSPRPRDASPIREEAVYNAIPQGVHGQRPDLLQVRTAAKEVQSV